MTQGTRRRTAGIALGATVLVHACVAWWLMGLRQTTTPPAPTALAVTWIERPAPVIPPPSATPAPAPIPPDTVIAPPTRAPRHAMQAVDVAPVSSDVATPLPTADALLEQAGAWARQQAPAADFSHDPLQHRDPPAADGRFAMRRSLSPEDIARGIGQLFGGAGYTQNPCPQIRRNIANLGTGGDAELRHEEIRRLQQYCL